ncbi:TonB-dependent receptor plug domain-containing protein [Hymenobacter lutimineralis]|uniref:TonB-dependent receptor plug domain-containing protein n=1 Tax=Hymenobacter lutimineralis TaxID=2606448 RepID=A0A5D6UXT5_9BACT|nr:TonB-dependent receptor plug domain-containing protein [Hymenobacter lutimineralis]
MRSGGWGKRPVVGQSSLWLLVATLFLALPPALAQQAARVLVQGTVLDAGGLPLELAGVGVEGQPGGTNTDAAGRFSLTVTPPTAARPLVLVVRRIGYQTLRQPLDLANARDLKLTLQTDNRALSNVTIRARPSGADPREQVSITPIDPRAAKELPSAFGDFNKILTTLPGVVANNELTSTYAVRGGNYEENLVYVNGFEVYRPFLVTSAQQEGLSFINPDLVENVEFSSGGWQPRYGDKLASVLSVNYKRPERFAASATASLTGGTAHVEVASPNRRLTYLVGVRYKNPTYVFNTLRTAQGQYNPTFYDAQVYLTAGLGRDASDPSRTTLSLLTAVAHNDFLFSPVSGQATFSTGTAQFQRLTILYDGHERMQYDTYQTGLSLRRRFTNSFTGELQAGLLLSKELEYRDVEAGYFFADINRDPNSQDYNREVRQRDVGSSFKHSRNTLQARVGTLEARTEWTPGTRHTVLAGAKAGQEHIEDVLNEYSYVDSADFVPDYRRTRLRSSLNLDSYRYQGYVQDRVTLDSLRTLTYGLRAHYWTANGQLVVSPRAQYSFITRRNPCLSFKFGTGLYYQPPFYRELRRQVAERAAPQAPLVYAASLNPELRAQRSLHVIAGSDLRFEQWGRPFRLTGEVYYKYMTDVVPYDVDNVRLRYFARNNATAYAAGFDARVSGEFVKGDESWISLGVLTTRENLSDDSLTVFDADGQAVGKQPKGYIRRPSDQRLNLGIFFQDHLPNNPSVKGYVNLVFGSGLPFSPPEAPELRGTTKLTRSYKRVDIGFSKVLSLQSNAATRRPGQLESLWLGLEVLNIIAANNIGGYNYVQDLNGLTYAVPNYLSPRVVNVRVIARF